jgi:hypothetical protein
MLVRIRLYRRRDHAKDTQQSLALGLAALLTPSALVAFTISFWSIAAHLHWTTDFFVSSGLFSHWQAWLIAAAVLFLAARVLNRYASREDASQRNA